MSGALTKIVYRHKSSVITCNGTLMQVRLYNWERNLLGSRMTRIELTPLWSGRPETWGLSSMS